MNYSARVEQVLYSALPNVPSRWSTEHRIHQLQLAQTIRPDLPFAEELLVGYLWPVDASAAKKELDSLVAKFGMNVLHAHHLSDLALEGGRVEEAREVLIRIKDKDLDGETAWKLGNLELAQKNEQDAVRWYELAMEESTKMSAWSLTHCAEAYTSVGRLSDAEEAMEHALRAVESGVQQNLAGLVHLRYADWLEDQGRAEEAEKVFRDVLSMASHDNHNGRKHEEYASFLLRDGRPSEAITVLKAGIKAFTSRLQSSAKMDSLRKHLLRGELHKLQGQLGRAYMVNKNTDKALELVLEMRDDHPYTSRQVGFMIDIFVKAGVYEEALIVARMGELTEALRADPLISSHVQQSLYTVERADPEILSRVKQSFDRAERKDGTTRELLGRLEVRRGLGMELSKYNYLKLSRHKSGADALEILEEALKVYPDSYELIAVLALNQRWSGAVEESSESLELAIRTYEDEVNLLAPFASEGNEPPNFEMALRGRDAFECREFLLTCILAAGQELDDEMKQRLERSIAMILGDPSIVSELQRSLSQNFLDLDEKKRANKVEP